jgi:hypothetical protein
MKLTRQEEEYTRQVAAQIGADPEAMIREGEQLKAEGAAQAMHAAEATLARGGGRGLMETEPPWGGPVRGIRGLQADAELEAD